MDESDSKNEKQWDEFWKFREKNVFGKLISFVRRKYVTKKFISFIFTYTKKGTLIEAGCGTGEITLRVAQMRGDRVVLLDSSYEALQQAKTTAVTLGVDATYMQHDLLALPDVISNERGATVFNIGVIEHFSDCAPALRAMAAVSDYPAIAIVPAHSFFWTTYIGLFRALGLLPDDFYVYLFKKNELAAVVEGAGLQCVDNQRIVVLGCIPYLAIFFTR